jgi:hypothetical protein
MSRFSIAATGYRGETVISSRFDGAVVGLGRSAQHCTLPNDIVRRLINVAAARDTLDDRSEVVKGLANQWGIGAAHGLLKVVCSAVATFERTVRVICWGGISAAC